MKKFILLLLVAGYSVLYAQDYDTIRLPKGNISITPELAKNLLLYSYAEITDSFLLGETNFAITCHEDYCIYDYLNHFHPKWRVFGGLSTSFNTFGYYFASTFTNGYVIVSDMPEIAGLEDYGYYFALLYGNQALFNKQGKACIPFKKFDNITQGVYEGLVTVCKDKKWGFASPNGIVKIKPQYENARHFSEGLAAVKKGGLWGYIDKQGNEKIPCIYTWAGDFKRGVAVVEMTGVGYGNHGKWPNNRGFALGLVDHTGQSSFDLLHKDWVIREYEGAFVYEVKELNGNVKYSYYENEKGNRIYHGYFVFCTDNYRIEGHYKDGIKYGKWAEEWYNKSNDYVPYFHDYTLTANDIVIQEIKYDSFGIPIQGSAYYNGDMKIECSFNAINGIIQDKVLIDGKEILLDEKGQVNGEISYEDYGYDGNLPIKLTLELYKGVPVKVIEFNNSTGKQKTVFEYEEFSSIEEIEEIVSGGKTLYKIGDYYYKIESKDPRYPFDIIDIGKYSNCISKPLSFLMNLPASWPVPGVKSPQLNFFKRASWADLKGVYYTQYRMYFTSEKEFDEAYSIGEGTFMRIVYEKQDELKRNAFQQYQHLFCDNKDFNTYYSKGEELFTKEIAIRDSLHSHYLLSKDWFADFCDYYKTHSSGVQPEEELRERQKEFEKNKEYFINSKDFIKYYAEDPDNISVEVEQRQNMFKNSIDSFSKSPLFKDLNEFLKYYCKGNVSLEISNRIQENKARINGQYGSLFVDMSDFDSFYEQGNDLFMKEAAFRKFRTKIEEFSELKLKEATTSKKEAIKQYLDFVNECTEISQKAYPRIVKLMVSSNEKMSKEWSSNGHYFYNEVDFYEAYISENYKEILNNRKK